MPVGLASRDFGKGPIAALVSHTASLVRRIGCEEEVPWEEFRLCIPGVIQAYSLTTRVIDASGRQEVHQLSWT